ncbi:MAG: hypothetical protein L0Y71_15930 [Gemmataceae bacterium]|nr:hypothetical protein [Gemmataceae bacterium]
MDSPQCLVTARQGAALFDLGVSVVELAGPDARLFLHNLCTQDVKNLPPGAGVETFLTTAKARVVAHGAVSHLLWQGQPALWFDSGPGHGERILNHLNHFLISEQVELADRSNDLAMLRLVGPSAAALLENVVAAPLPATPWHHVTRAVDGTDVIIRHQVILNLPGYDCFFVRAQAPALRERLIAAGAVAGSDATHELLRVEAGWPVYPMDMDENRFVVEVGRAAQAICFTKGCFLGQEPIVMARDRGQANRLLMGVLCGAGSALAPGTRLFQEDAEVGQATSSVVSPRLGQAIALAYLRRGHQQPGMRLTVEPLSAGRVAQVSELPFGQRT